MGETVKLGCHVCGTQIGTLIRQNEKGVPGIFACIQHSTKPADPVLAEVTAICEKACLKPTEH